LQYRMLGKKNVEAWWKKVESLWKMSEVGEEMRSLVKQYWSLVEFLPTFACWETVIFYWSFELVCML
jgi:hypothetical protein